MENQQFNDRTSIRKKWLISFLTILSIDVAGLIIDIFNDPNFTCILKTYAKFSLWALITYFCSYKNYGTSWLMFNLIWIPIQILYLCLQVFIYKSLDYLFVNLFILTPLAVWFWINCFKLRKFNKMKSLEI